MRYFLFYTFLFNSLALQAAEPPKLILQTTPQAAKTLALPINSAPTEVTTGRLEFNGYIYPKEITTTRLEFNGKAAFNPLKTELLSPAAIKPKVSSPTAPPPLTYAPSPLSLPMPATKVLPSVTVPVQQPPEQVPALSVPVQAQIPVTDNINIIKQLPAETTPVAPKNKPLLLKPIMINPQNQ